MGFLDIQTTTTVMQYVLGGLMALLPAVIWGYIFYRKSPENRKTVVISFIAGALSVIPMFIWQKSWTFSFNFLGLQIHHLNIYDYAQVLSRTPSWENFFIFIIVAITISLIIYVSAALITFFADLVFGTKLKDALNNILRRSFEEPLIFISTGVLIALLIVLVSNILSLFFLQSDVIEKLLQASFWTSMMIGFLEEYTKHLVVRFADDHAIYSIDSAIEFALIVGLGFAFLENIIYFVNRIWLSPCTAVEIANSQCLFEAAKGVYMHQVGVLLMPFVFRSALSTLAHLLFSGVFGYFYGTAHFASYELQEAEKKKVSHNIWKVLHQIFRLKTSVVFHEVKMLQGLFFAMIFHGFFDFALDQEKTFLTVPMLFVGYLYLNYLFQKTENRKKLRLISDIRTSRQQMVRTVQQIEMLEKFEGDYLKKRGVVEKKNDLDLIEKNVELLKKYEEQVKKREEKDRK